MSNKKTKKQKVTSKRFFSGIKNLPEDKPQQLPDFQTTDRSPDDLLPTTTIVELAKRQGVDFGPGDEQERVRYFIKLGLLPHASRKTPQNDKSANPIGHMPIWTIKRFIWIARLSQGGNSYPQIAQKLKSIEERKTIQEITESNRVKEDDVGPAPPVHDRLPVLSRIAIGAFLAPVAIFLVVWGLLMFGGQKTASFLQVPSSYHVYTKNTADSSVTTSPSPVILGSEATRESEVADSGQARMTNNGIPSTDNKKLLGVKTSLLTIKDKIYGLFVGLLRPFTNLAEVMMNGARQEINYTFAPTSKNQALTINPSTSTTTNNYLPFGQDGSITVNGVATFNSLLQAASVSAGSLNVSGNTTIGTTAADTLKINASLASDLIPSTTAKYSLGSGGQRFKTGYFSDNVYIGSENRLGSDGMTTTGSLYIKTGNGGSIYLQSDSGVVYLGKSTNKLTNSDAGSDFTLDAAGGGRLCFRSCSNNFDTNNNETVGGNLTVGGTITSSSSSGSSFSGPFTITSTTTPQLSVRYDANNRLDTSVSSTGAVTFASIGTGNVVNIANPLSVTGTGTFSSNVAVNGGSITTSASTGNLFNSTATTVNIGGAATTVGIGASTGTTTVNNALSVTGNTTIGASSSNTVAYNGRSTTSFVPNATASVDLGLTSLRWNNLWVQTINTTGTNSSGQASFTYQPTTTAISEGSVLINPTTVSPVNVALLSVAVGGVEKARINSNGYLGLNGANDPGTTYFINAGSTFNVTTAGATTTPIIYGGSATTSTLSLRSTSGVGATGADIIFGVGTAGGTEAMRIINSGNVGIGTTAPASLLDVRGGHLRVGSNTFAKAALGSGEIALDNGGTDTPGIHFYSAANTNFGIDSSASTLRFVSNLDESGGAVRMNLNSTGLHIGDGAAATNGLDVLTNASIGYSSVAAPTTGLIVAGNVGILITQPLFTLGLLYQTRANGIKSDVLQGTS